MYPFGSGMPQPPPQSAQNNHVPNVPFGAGFGWQAPPNPNQPAQYPGYPGGQPQNPYPQNPAPYPSHNPYPDLGQTPYPTHPQQQQHSVPPFGSSQYGYQAPYPSGPQNPPYQQSPYPPSSTTPYPPQSHHHQAYPSDPAPNPGYPSYHGSGIPSHGPSDMHSGQSSSAIRREGTPTVTPHPNFDPVKDAHDLRKAMKGFGTDEDTLINIICRRSNEQRQEIQRQYKTHFGKDLIEDIKSETSGNFEKLLVGLLRPIVDFYCTEICDAMAGIGTDEDVLIEILCTLSNYEIHTIKNAYVRMYGAHLESELKSETSGNFKRLLVSLCTAARDESNHTDPVAAQADARELLKAGELRVGTDESTFNMILCQRNYQQLRLIFQEYEKMTGHTLEKAIKKEFSGDIMDGLLAIYKCVTNKAEYFASRLHKSMAGIGTNDKQLVRVVISRSEIDLHDIKVAFERLYGKSLKSWIKGDTSGHYKHALYALCGEQRSS